MKIAVLGWYGHENAGDERIKFCLNHFLMGLGGIEKVEFFDLHEHAIKGKTQQFDPYDLVIIGGGGLILSHYNYHDFILGIGTKVLTAGISVETELKGNPKKFAQALLEKSSVFLVRDKSSYEKLKNLDNNSKVKLSADLTFLLPYEVVNNHKKNIIGINLLAKTNYAPLLLRTLIFLSRHRFKFPLKTLDFSLVVKELQELCDLLPIPLYCVQQEFGLPEHMMNDVNYLGKYFKDTPNSFVHTDIDKCRVLLSMRLHGLIFAVQKGIPIFTLSTYPKQTNFMKELGIGNCLIELNQLEKTKKTAEHVLQNEDLIKEKILIFRDKAIRKIKEDLVDALNKTLYM